MGEVPLWNRYNAAGRPLWGQGLSYILDPLHWLTLVTPDPLSGWDLKFVAHRFVFAAGIGLVAWRQRARGCLRPWPQRPHRLQECLRIVSSSGHLFSYLCTVGAPGMVSACENCRPDQHVQGLALIASGIFTGTRCVSAEGSSRDAARYGDDWCGDCALVCRNLAERGQRFAAGGMAGVIVVLLTMPHWLVFLDTLDCRSRPTKLPMLFRLGCRMPWRCSWPAGTRRPISRSASAGSGHDDRGPYGASPASTAWCCHAPSEQRS